MIATLNLLDLKGIQALDSSRNCHNIPIISNTIRNACLAEIVQAPRVNDTIDVDGEGMVRAACNLGDLAFGERKHTRSECGVLIAIGDLATKLVLLARAPTKSITFVVES